MALIAERVSGARFHDLVEQRVCAPAGLLDTAFLRSDALLGRAALGDLSTSASTSWWSRCSQTVGDMQRHL